MSDTSGSDYFVEFSSGNYVFRQNDRGDEMFIVEEGEIDIILEGSDGERLLTTLERGDFFGEMAILESLPRATSARARATSRLLRIDRPVFDQIIRTNPEFAVRMLRAFSSRLREADEATKAPVDAPKTPASPPGLPGGRLVSPSGESFPLAPSGDSTVGRYDASTKTSPEVDLGALDEKKTTSRRHARISRRGDRFFLQEDVGTANGTFVNGTRVQPGVEHELSDGDQLRFGVVELTFEKS